MENVLPIIFLIFWLVISSIAKRRKASQGEPAAPGAEPREREPAGALKSILEALAEQAEEAKPKMPDPFSAQKDWLGVEHEVEEEEILEPQEEPPVVTRPEPVEEGRPSTFRAEPAWDEEAYARPVDTPYERPEETPYERPVEEPYDRPVEKPYRVGRQYESVLDRIDDMPILKKGILFQEILGQPRALRNPKDWFHRFGS